MLPVTRADKIAMIRRVIRREPIVPEFTDGPAEVTYRFAFGKGDAAKDAARSASGRISNALPFEVIARVDFARDAGWFAELRIRVGRKNMRLHAERYEGPSQLQIAAYNASRSHSTGPRAGQSIAEQRILAAAAR